MSTKFLSLQNSVILQKALHHVSLQSCSTHSTMEDECTLSCHVCHVLCDAPPPPSCPRPSPCCRCSRAPSCCAGWSSPRSPAAAPPPPAPHQSQVSIVSRDSVLTNHSSPVATPGWSRWTCRPARPGSNPFPKALMSKSRNEP